ncbi:MAG: S41 family peptidase [Bacteroidetes bacterium]|nr:S41 family peptidase [Bacteroidota bacterium]MCH8523728.1 S41 family peptidase [Balneolales bacterium]
MSIRRFLAPNIIAVLILGFAWFLGHENILKEERNDQINLQKYIQVQRVILDNHFSEVNVNDLYRSSLKGFIRNIETEGLDFSATPLDTSVTNHRVSTLREAVQSFERAYRFLASVAPGEDLAARTDDAIIGMFAMLDPHSNYLEPERAEREQEQFSGRFQGIGVQFDIIADTITVVSAISGGPSDKLGIQSGDRIIQIDDVSAIGFTNQQVVSHLRGPKGTTVDVVIRRPRMANPLNFTITRDNIPIYTVDSSYMIDDDTGYLKISNFATTTYDEFMQAMESLKDQGMNRLVLDLRSNPGGYLIQAFRIVGEFFPAGTPIVATESRHARFISEYNTQRNGQFRDLPLIVMVDEGSASGSEIVAGAIQDFDRGLIVGRRTYGKGLVQVEFSLVDNSSVRITTSQYTTPSGRLIQKPFLDGREAYAYELFEREDALTDASHFVANVPDSLRFSTRSGRPIFGGGGILPDHILQRDTTRSFVFGFMRQRNLNTEFVRSYMDEYGDEVRSRWRDDFPSFLEEFTWSDEFVEGVRTRMIANGLVLTDTVSINSPILEGDQLFINPEAFERDRWILEGSLKAELSRQIWDTQHYFQVFNTIFDTTLRDAVTLWEEVNELKALADQSSPPRRSSTSLYQQQ